MARDFVFGSGTAESPPAVVLVLLVLAALLAAVRGRVSVIGCVAVAALSDWIAAVNAFRLAMETERTAAKSAADGLKPIRGAGQRGSKVHARSANRTVGVGSVHSRSGAMA